MRDFSKVSPSVWRSKKFKKLRSDGDRLVYLYLLTCPHGNSAGCFDLDPAYACIDLGIPEKAYIKAIESLSQVGLIDYDSEAGTVLIVNWATFNEPTNGKHAIGLINQIDAATSPRLKGIALATFRDIIEAKGYDNLEVLRKSIDRLSKGYEKGIPTRPDQTRPEKDLEGDAKPAPSEGFDLKSVVEHWNTLASSHKLPKVQQLTDSRRKALKARIEAAGGVEAFLKVIDTIPASPFLLGQNDRGWKADLDFVLQPNSFVKLSEGRYHDDGQQNPTAGTETADEWQERMAWARRNRQWTSKWGPPPHQAGCIVPPALLTPDDGKGWTEWVAKRGAA